MTLKEIIKAVDKFQTVYWSNDNYQVIKDQIGQYLIWSKHNNHYVGLMDLRGNLIEKETDFYIKS